MARRIYFAFHYQDVADLRANVVRNHWRFKEHRQEAGYYDWSLWEEAADKGPVGLKRLINSGLEGTTVTCVLVGTETYLRPWVRYELLKSFKRGSELLAIHINMIKGKDQKIKPSGSNPLHHVGVTFSESGITATLHEKVGGKWRKYSEIDGRASYQVDPVPAQYRGRGFLLGNFFNTYDWVADNGYANFKNWVA